MSTTTNDPDSVLDDVVPLETMSNYASSTIQWVDNTVLTADVGIQFAVITLIALPLIYAGKKITASVRKRLDGGKSVSIAIRIGRPLTTLITPVTVYSGLWVARVVLSSTNNSTGLVAAAISLMSAWIIVRLATLTIQSRQWSRIVFYTVWSIAALDVLGLLAPIVEQMKSLSFEFGDNKSGDPNIVTLFDVVRTLFFFAILFWGARFIGNFIEQGIHQLSDASPAFKALSVKILKIILPVIALLIAFQMVGFNIATLAIFSGAVGLGIGLGLQKIVANFIAGFTLIADKSIKPHDAISIDNTFGWVTSMQSRYVALKTRDGTELLIPNERFMTEGVVNWSRSDRTVRLHAPFGVSYNTRDLVRVRDIAIDAAKKVDRVVSYPAPACNIMAFGDSSVDFDLRFWITDPENGIANVRSAVYFELWEGLHENSIEVPFPQRDLHIKSMPETKMAHENG